MVYISYRSYIRGLRRWTRVAPTNTHIPTHTALHCKEKSHPDDETVPIDQSVEHSKNRSSPVSHLLLHPTHTNLPGRRLKGRTHMHVLTAPVWEGSTGWLTSVPKACRNHIVCYVCPEHGPATTESRRQPATLSIVRASVVGHQHRVMTYIWADVLV